MSLLGWAYEIAERELAPTLPQRWLHVQGVARKAGTLAGVVGRDAEVLEAAAVLHDIGYAPRLAGTGFHPLDGARFLRETGGPERIVNLVARHSCAILEADLRGLLNEVLAFVDEEGPVRDALWHCDITTTPDGQPTDIASRMAEIKQRYGLDHLVTRFISIAEPELLVASQRTMDRLARLTTP